VSCSIYTDVALLGYVRFKFHIVLFGRLNYLLMTCPVFYRRKCSAVAEMGDRLATIDMGQKVGAAVPLFGKGELDSHLTQCRLGRSLPPYQVASSSI